MECILDRSRKSLEHLKRFVELFYNEIFMPWFVTCTGDTKRDSQMVVVRTVVSMWQRNPTRCLQIIEKLWQLGIVDASNGIEWAIKSLKAKDQSTRLTDTLEYRIVKLLSERTLQKSAFLQTLYIQRGTIGQLVQP